MKSIASRLLPFAAVACTLVSMSGSAFADALPPDACQESQVGQTCDNAGSSADEPGVCVSGLCPHFNPEDGGETQVACYTCEPSDGGTSNGDGGSTGDGGGAITTRPDGGSDNGTSSGSSSSSCSFSPGERDGAAGFAMFALGLVGLALSRKKRA